MTKEANPPLVAMLVAKYQGHSHRGLTIRDPLSRINQAELNLRYTRVIAPVAGVVGKRTVEVGQNVEPGQVLLSIVPLDDIWVTANFKETQLRRMRPGPFDPIIVTSRTRPISNTLS